MMFARGRLKSLVKTIGIRAGKRFVAAGYYTAPSFLGIGAQKAGTSSLFRYLSHHPQIVKGSRKEMHFFCEHYDLGMSWYRAQFPVPFQMRPGAVTYEVTPHYMFVAHVPQRIFQYNPQIKLIVSLRDPIARAFSGWNMTLKQGRSREGSFDELVLKELKLIEAGECDEADSTQPTFIRRGLYYDQLMRYFALFPREQLLIFENTELQRNTPGMMHRIVDFLGLNEYPWEKELYPTHHVGKYAGAMAPTTRERLVEFYRPNNEKLYELLGINYGWT